MFAEYIKAGYSIVLQHGDKKKKTQLGFVFTLKGTLIHNNLN